MFELEDGRLAVAHHDGNYAMTRDDVPPMMMEIFPKIELYSNDEATHKQFEEENGRP
jgi:hypothetical protein